MNSDKYHLGDFLSILKVLNGLSEVADLLAADAKQFVVLVNFNMWRAPPILVLVLNEQVVQVLRRIAILFVLYQRPPE